MAAASLAAETEPFGSATSAAAADNDDNTATTTTTAAAWGGATLEGWFFLTFDAFSHHGGSERGELGERGIFRVVLIQ